MNYYNENDPYAAQWLRNLITEKLIPNGEVDERSILDVRGTDVAGFTQCHFFAGIAGWSLALKLAGWPEGREVWTGSCPCQPFSVAGKRQHQTDARHLWPEWFRLIRECRPATIFGEQVAAAAGSSWLDRVFVDMEEIGYAAGAAVVPACAVNAPHRRDRLWFVAYTDQSCTSGRGLQRSGELGGTSGHSEDCPGSLAHADSGSIRNEPRRGNGKNGESGEDIPYTEGARLQGTRSSRRGRAGLGNSSGLAPADTAGEQMGPSGQPRADGYVADADSNHGHWRRSPVQVGRGWGTPEIQADTIPATVEWLAQSGIRLLAHGVPVRVGRLRAYGNAIVPQVGAEMIAAFMELRP